MASIAKIHSILELLQRNCRKGMSNKEISRALEIPPSTCYRILAALKKYDYVCQRRPDMRYYLGYAHLRLAESVIEGMDEAAISLPYLEELHQETEETTFFARLSGELCIAMEMCGYINTRISVGRGEVMPFYCSAAGMAVLAFMGEKERRRVLKNLTFKSFTEYTITDPDKLEIRLAEIYECGVAYNLQEFHNGINAMAAPIFDRQNKVLGALAIVGTSVDLDREQLEEYSRLFLEAGSDISGALGGKYPERLLKERKNG